MTKDEAIQELGKVEDAIYIFSGKVESQGRIVNARDSEHLQNLRKYKKELLTIINQ